MAKYGATTEVFTPAFFDVMGDRIGHRVEVYLAERGTTPIAASFNFASVEGVYPKQWGALEDVPHLHFEVTWYHAMEEAIARGLRFVDAGGVTETKLVRGFLPVGVRHGATWIGDDDLRGAFAKLIAKEQALSDAEATAALAKSPFKE